MPPSVEPALITKLTLVHTPTPYHIALTYYITYWLSSNQPTITHYLSLYLHYFLHSYLPTYVSTITCKLLTQPRPYKQPRYATQSTSKVNSMPHRVEAVFSYRYCLTTSLLHYLLTLLSTSMVTIIISISIIIRLLYSNTITYLTFTIDITY